MKCAESSISSPAWVLSRPARGEAEEALSLLQACDLAQYGVAETTIEDLTEMWDEVDLTADVWLCRDVEGTLRGYVCVSPEGDRVNCDFYTLPEAEWAGAAEALLQAASGRAAEIAAQDDAIRPVAFTIQAGVSEAARAAARACGYAVVRHHFRMQLDLVEAPPAPTWPQGITLRNVRAGADDDKLHAFIQRAFARAGRVPQTLDAWRGFMMRADHFRPDLWFLAEAEGELVGAALCYDYPEGGWVRQLAVAEEWRRRGLGSALLRHAFGVFHAAGKPGVGLAVMSENERAYRLYEQVGMQRQRQYDEYERELSY